MNKTSEDLIRGGRVLRRSPGQDAALLFLSPVWLLVGVFIAGFPPATIAGWVAGAIILWRSRAWRAGEKLIGTVLSGISLIYGGIFGVSVWTRDLDRVGAALALLSFLFVLQMVPATVGVTYLWMKLRARSGRLATSEQADEHLAD
jgi:hypothetical protein